MNRNYRQWLMELTSLPTASGREDCVIAWIERWVKARRDCELWRDRYGNLVIERVGQRGKMRSRKRATARRQRPVYLTAHLDHPAFVVRQVRGPREVVADFRGGVGDAYFVGSRVKLHAMVAQQKGKRATAQPIVGTITALTQPRPGAGGTQDKSATVRFPRDVRASVGDVLTWNIPPTRIVGDKVLAPACDDLAGVAAALAAFDAVAQAKGPAKGVADVQLLFTLAEEVGFIGAIAACKARTIPRDALVIALENSKSFAESPIGAGPIVRVGDRTSTFDPDLTYRVGLVAQQLAKEDKRFQFQRKLRPGGTCEASAYQTYGYTATCICLPLGNYHNMNEERKKIDAERISLRDFDNLVKLLAALPARLNDPKLAPPLKERLEKLFESRRELVDR